MWKERVTKGIFGTILYLAWCDWQLISKGRQSEAQIRDLLNRKDTSERRDSGDVIPQIGTTGQAVLTSADWFRTKPEGYSPVEQSLLDTDFSTFKH
jgi:hypothetical protein